MKSVTLDVSLKPSELKYFIQAAKKYGVIADIVKPGGPGSDWPVVKFSAERENSLWKFVTTEYDKDFDEKIFKDLLEQIKEQIKEQLSGDKHIMETKDLIKQAQAGDLVNFESATKENVMNRLQNKIEQYQQYVGYQASEYFKHKDAE